MNLKEVFEKFIDFQNNQVSNAEEADKITVFAINKKGRIFNVKGIKLDTEDDGSKSVWIEVEEAN